MNADQSFPRRMRIRERHVFDRAFREGKVVSDHCLVVRGFPNGREYSRLGLAIPRRTGSAPVRNLWKRIIREAFRQSRPSLPAGWDLVVRPRRGAENDWESVRRSLVRLANRLATTGESRR